MSNGIREFGTPVADVHYVLRPGGYAIILREPGSVAVLATPRGNYLPGGGQEHGETPELAAVRETREECGLAIRIVEPVGIADQLVYAVGEATYFRKHCTFFLAALTGEAAVEGEADHVLSWMSPEEASACLRHESQRWAVAEACGMIKP